ncbi:MAG: fibronectin type III domain-containing protein, partial [Elusimicrobiota bacterium]
METRRTIRTLTAGMTAAALLLCAVSPLRSQSVVSSAGTGSATQAEGQVKVFKNPRGQGYYYAVVQNGSASNTGVRILSSPNGTVWTDQGQVYSGTAYYPSVFFAEDGANSRLNVYIGQIEITDRNYRYVRVQIPDATHVPTIFASSSFDIGNRREPGDTAVIVKDRNGNLVTLYGADEDDLRPTFRRTTANPETAAPTWSGDIQIENSADWNDPSFRPSIQPFGGTGNLAGAVYQFGTGSGAMVIRGVNLTAAYAAANLTTIETGMPYTSLSSALDADDRMHILYENSATSLVSRRATNIRDASAWSAASSVSNGSTIVTAVLTVDKSVTPSKLHAFYVTSADDKVIRHRSSPVNTIAWNQEEALSTESEGIDYLSAAKADQSGYLSLIYTAQSAQQVLFRRHPVGYPDKIANFAASSGTTAGAVKLSWSAPSAHPVSTAHTRSTFTIHYTSVQASAENPLFWSTASAQVHIATSSVSPGALQQKSLTLDANTTWFFRIWTKNEDEDYSQGLSNGATVVTLANPLTDAAVSAVHQTSVTLNWTALPAAPQKDTSEGYVLQACEQADFSGTILSSSTANRAVSALTVTGLDKNTTYYFRAGSLNWIQVANYAAAVSTATRATPVSGGQYTGVFESSAAVSWTALPPAPQNASAAAYVLQASPNADFSSGVLYSSTTDVAENAHVVTGLSFDTTYYFRIAALNIGGAASYANLSATSTLAAQPGAPAVAAVYQTSAAVSWTDIVGQGYRLEASENADFSGTIYPVATTNGDAVALTVTGLTANTTYFYRAASINWGGSPNYIAVDAASTLALQPAAPSYSWVFVSSAAASWTAVNADGYRLEASSTNYNGTGTVYFSSTTDGGATQLTLLDPELEPNTTYYLRAGAYNHNSALSYALLGATVTRTNLPTEPTAFTSFVTSMTVSWGEPAGGAAGYRLELALNSSFSPLATSSSTDNGALTSLGVTGLSANTTYYFRAASRSWNGTHSYAVPGATSTLTNPPQSPNLDEVGLSSLTMSWTAPAGGARGFRLEASVSQDFSDLILFSSTTDGGATSLDLTGLYSNTTYYLRVAALNWTSRAQYVNAGSTLTDTAEDFIGPDPIANLAAQTDTPGTMLLTWLAPFDATDDPLDGNYAIQASSWTGVVWATANAQVAFSTSGVYYDVPQGRTVGGLDPNTTYYFHLWTSDLIPNWSPLSNRATAATLAPDIENVAVGQDYENGLLINWTPLPASPSSHSAQGYRLEASSTNFAGGTVFSSATALVSLSTLTVSGLLSNTTYFYRAGALNHAGVPNYAAVNADATLAVAPSLLSSNYVGIFFTSATLHWAARPPSPPAATAEGYRLEASSTNFDGSGIVYASATNNVALSTLTVAGLETNRLYYFRTGALNWEDRGSYTSLGSTPTLANPPTGAAFTGVHPSSVSLSWELPAGGASGFRIQASSTDFDGSGAVLSSATFNGAQNSLTVLGLLSNTTYYFRTGSLTKNDAFTTYAAAIATATLAPPPAKLGANFIGVFKTSVTAHWAALPAAPQDGTSEGYRLEASADAGFMGLILASSTWAAGQSTLTVAGLDANTTYYFRVGSRNWNGAVNSVVLSATSTLAQAPTALAQTYLEASSVAIRAAWAALQVWPLADTAEGYMLEAWTSPDFTGTRVSSQTAEISESTLTALSPALSPQSTYYFRVGSLNHNGVPNFTTLGSTATWTADISPSTAAVYLTSVTVGWNAVNANGYVLEAWTNADYSGSAVSSRTTMGAVEALTALSPALANNTTYYFRAGALNHFGAVNFAALGPVSTLADPITNVQISMTGRSSATVSWTALPGSPLADTSEGYRLEACVEPDLIDTSLGSETGSAASSELTVTGLASYTEYFFRAGALNH